MTAYARALMTFCGLLASAALAEARSRLDAPRPHDIPLPVERPFMIEGVRALTIRAKPADAAAVGQGTVPVGQRFAMAAKSGNVENAAPTPRTRSGQPAGNAREAPAPTLRDLVTRHARDNGVPVNLAQAVIRIESRGNPLASHRGALGLMQIKPGTARAVGFSGAPAGLLVADTNLRFGMKVLGQALRTSGGDVCRALLFYQSGHLATHVSAANRTYCSKARAFMAGA